MGDPWEGLLLVEEYWLLTTGAQPVTRPSQGTWLGITMAALRDLERAGEIRWRESDHGPYLHAINDCRCPEMPPFLGGWHDRLQSADPTMGGVAARFALDPLLSIVWKDVAQHLARTGPALEDARLLGANTYRVADVDAMRARRRELFALVDGCTADVQDLPAREHDLFIVASASDSLSDLFRVPGLEPPGSVLDAIERATRGSLVLRHLEAAAGHRYTPFPMA